MSRGGARKGAGRPKGQGRYGEPTQPLRVPQSLVADVQDFMATRGHRLPLFSSRVAAGLPATAEDHIEDHFDLHSELAPRPAETFLLRVSGESMLNAGINDGDLLVIDRSIPATHGKIVIAAVDGELTVKRLWRKAGEIKLLPENDAYPVIPVAQESDLIIWGVVTNVIHPV